MEKEMRTEDDRKVGMEDRWPTACESRGLHFELL